MEAVLAVFRLMSQVVVLMQAQPQVIVVSLTKKVHLNLGVVRLSR